MILADLVTCSIQDITETSGLPRVEGVVIGDLFCVRRHSRDGSSLTDLLAAAREHGLFTAFRTRAYLVGESFDKASHELSRLIDAQLVGMVLLRDLGLASAFQGVGVELCWDLFGFGRAMRPTNLSALRVLSEVGIRCVETDRPSHLPAIHELGMHSMFAPGFEPPASISRRCYEKTFGSPCSADSPACLDEGSTLSVGGELRYLASGHMLRRAPRGARSEPDSSEESAGAPPDSREAREVATYVRLAASSFRDLKRICEEGSETGS